MSAINRPIDAAESELLATYRGSLAHDRVLLPLLLAAWAQLTPAQRGAVVRVAYLFASATRWRKRPEGAVRGAEER